MNSTEYYCRNTRWAGHAVCSADGEFIGRVCVCVCVVEGVGDVVLSNDTSQISARHTDVSDDVREL